MECWHLRRCLFQFRPTSATTQMLTVNVGGVGKDTPTLRFYKVILLGHAHVLLSPSTLQNYSADKIKSGLKPVPAMHIQSRSDPITVRTGL